jgi:enoyl-CoA hydratase
MPIAHYELEGPIATIRMDDGKANALSEMMLDELRSALERAEKEAGAVILTGRPDRFCAGFDLKVMMSGPQAADALLRRGVDLLMRLYGSPLPIVAACTGHALAAGALLLLASDVRIGAEGAFRIGLNEVSIGLTTPVFLMELARDRLATTELARATLCAQICGPQDAARVGFLDEIAPASELLSRARERAGAMAEYSRPSFHGTKERLRRRTIDHIRATLDEDLRRLTGGAA